MVSTPSSAASRKAARSATSPRARCGYGSTSPARWPTGRCRSRVATRTVPSASRSARSADLEAAVQARHGEHPHLGHVWITPTVLRAGDAVQMNVMPGRHVMWVDVRTTTVGRPPSADRRGDRRRRRGGPRPRRIVTAIEVIDDRPSVPGDRRRRPRPRRGGTPMPPSGPGPRASAGSPARPTAP